MKTSPEKPTPTVPRGLLLAALAIIAIAQIIYSCSAGTTQTNSADITTEKSLSD